MAVPKRSEGCHRLSRLQRLPVELQIEVCKILDRRSLTMLSRVSSVFQDMVRPLKKQATRRARDLEREQRLPEHCQNTSFETRGSSTVYRTVQAGYACFTCCKIKPMHAFASRRIIHCNKHGQKNFAMKNNLRCCIDCQIMKRAFRHGLPVKLLKKTSTKMEDGKVISIRVLEADEMRYCDRCDILHSRSEWDTGDCNKMKPTKRALRRQEHGGCKRSAFISLQRRVRPVMLAISCARCKINVHDNLKAYCSRCRHWICWMCLRGDAANAYAWCGEDEATHRLKLTNNTKEAKTLLREWQKSKGIGDVLDVEQALAILDMQ